MPAITKPNLHFDATLYTGSSSAQSITNAGGFQPDFVWGKNRTAINSHRLTDSVRGVGKVMFSDGTSANTTGDGQLSSFNSNGWTFTSGAGAGLNETGNNYVAWNWKAGGTAVTNTSGTISSQVSANPTAGFSVVTYTNTGSAGTVGHGLGIAPQMIIAKSSASVENWQVYHVSVGNTYNIYLNTTAAKVGPSNTYWNSTSPTSTVFSVNSWANADAHVAYCFAPVAGYSAFGSYVGNSSADGPFLYTGFRPRWIMLKVASGQTGDWLILDTSRDTYNVASNLLYANSTAAQDSPGGYTVDIVSNGFKLRHSSFGFNNTSGTYIYAAFAEAPFKFSNGR